MALIKDQVWQDPTQQIRLVKTGGLELKKRVLEHGLKSQRAFCLRVLSVFCFSLLLLTLSVTHLTPSEHPIPFKAPREHLVC
jgi:hypothetical protein